MTSGEADVTDESAQDAIARLGPWFHNLHLPGGEQTFPGHPYGDFPAFKWRQVEPHLPADLAGATVLDIGCNAGFYSFEMARRGADVLGIDVDERYLRQAQWAAPRLAPEGRVRFERRDVYSLARWEGRFDVVLFMGVFYHLRHPLLGLDVVSRLVGGTLVFQTLTMPGDDVADGPGDVDLARRDALAGPGWPKMAFVEHHIAGDPTNWWAPNHACVEAMLRTAGLGVRSRPGHEIYVCTPDHPRDPVTAGLVDEELRQVLGEVRR
ncbi:TIGR04290 family methyltransferase [Myxococcota bacterium]|nr:TIGR04290 family methyltransferase [Myxococcota bacterium]